LLNGAAIPSEHSTFFTATEFSHLAYQFGDDQTQQGLVVVAQTGKLLSNGTLSMVTDSQAVQIIANVTGIRSMNAMAALTTTPGGADADVTALVKEANVFTGIGSGRPTLSTAGNFTAVTGDTYRLGELFKGKAPTGQSIAGYRIALGAGNGQLLLNGAAMPSDHSILFTATEFSHLPTRPAMTRRSRPSRWSRRPGSSCPTAH
jgi:hypothetical protein